VYIIACARDRDCISAIALYRSSGCGRAVESIRKEKPALRNGRKRISPGHFVTLVRATTKAARNSGAPLIEREAIVRTSVRSTRRPQGRRERSASAPRVSCEWRFFISEENGGKWRQRGQNWLDARWLIITRYHKVAGCIWRFAEFLPWLRIRRDGRYRSIVAVRHCSRPVLSSIYSCDIVDFIVTRENDECPLKIRVWFLLRDAARSSR